MSDAAPPGWYPDPLGRYEHRYFDGAEWSEHVSDRGIQASDPLDSGRGDADDAIADAELVEPKRVRDEHRPIDEVLVLEESAAVELVVDPVVTPADSAEDEVPVPLTSVEADRVLEVTPGWYPDPSGRGDLRYFDVDGWGPYVARAGESVLDPEGTTGIPDGALPSLASVDAGPRRWGRSEEEKDRRQEAKAAKSASKDLEKARRRDLRDAKARLKEAEKVRARALAEARGNVAAAERARQLRVDTAIQQLRTAEDPQGQRVGTYRGIVLFERFIVTPQGSGTIKGASATVDTAGNLAVSKRPTLTRMAAGGILLGPLGAVGSLAFQKRKDVDMRELYLMVETEQFAAVVQCPADDGMKARQFAAAITTAGRLFDVNEPIRHQTIEWANYEIDAASKDVAAIVAANENLARVEADESLRGEIESAQSALSAISAPPELNAGPPTAA